MGYFYSIGKGVRKNHKQAESWFRKATEQGHARGQFNLGVIYYSGTAEGGRNMEEAIRLYHRSADQGYVHPIMELAAIYACTWAVPQDLPRVANWYLKAAEQGNRKAHNKLAECYKKGLGVPQDFVTAASWLRKAADKDDPSALLGLYNCYLMGEGVPKDSIEADKLLVKAAACGDITAKLLIEIFKDDFA